jgi:Xaa-Pro aminopeptidase
MSVPPPEYLGARHAALAAALEGQGLDALLVGHPPNIAYLTGFFGSAGSRVATPAPLILVSDSPVGETQHQRGPTVPKQ